MGPTVAGATRPTKNTATQWGRRVGRRVSSPPQLGQMASIERAHRGQKVHSYEQMNASATCDSCA